MTLRDNQRPDYLHPTDRDYRIIVLEGATADPDPDIQAFLTNTIFPRHARVITVAEMNDVWA